MHTKRKTVLLMVLLSCCLVLYDLPVQALEFRLGAGFGGASVNTVAVHPSSGDLLAAGYFSGYTVFGDPAAASHEGARDIFWARVKSTGEVSLQTVSGTGALDEAAALAVDTTGNCYVTGTFSGSAVFGDGDGLQQTLTTPGLDSRDVFVAKYSASGALLWAVQANATADAYGYGIAVDDQGVYVVGKFSDQIFSGGFLKTKNAVSLFDAFVARYSPSGVLSWAASLETAGDATANDVALRSGNAVVTGSFGGTSNLNPGVATAGGYDLYVAEYQGISGALLSAATIVVSSGAGGEAEGRALWVDESGAFYIAGHFLGSLDFPGAALSSAGGMDAFCAKYDAAGNLVFARKAGGAGTDAGTGITVDNTGSVYVAGVFSDGAVFDGDDQATAHTAAGGKDLFIAGYDGDGNFVAVVKAGGAGDDMIRGLMPASDGQFVAPAHLASAAELKFSGSMAWDLALNALAVPAPVVGIPGDVSRNGTLGVEDALGILQIVSGLRP